MTLLSALVLSLAACRAPAAADTAVYHWPLAKEPALTSSFGEFRGGWRFHAGIDLKTWGRTGYDVHAVADGYVWRVRVEPNGYGRVVYLKLNDGRFAVYAHLDSFNDAITALVRAAQERNGSFRADIYLAPGDLPVRAGDVMGRSGRSGIRYPHLHFEMRNGRHEPLNPERFGFLVDDTTPPVPTALSVRPFGIDGSVDGSTTYRIYPLHVRDDRGDYVVPAPIMATGILGLGVANYDRADAASHNMNVYELRLSVDDSSYFTTRYDSISYAENHLSRLDREYLIKAHGDGLFQRLYRDTGNSLRLYRHPPGTDGRLYAGRLAPGPHAVAVTLKDYHGNTARVRCTVVTGIPPAVSSVRREGRGAAVVTFAPGTAPVASVEVASSADGDTWRTVTSLAPPGSVRTVTASGLPADEALRITATGGYGMRSPPRYLPAASSADTGVHGVRSDSVTYHRTFAEWHVTLTGIPAGPPAAAANTVPLTVRPLSARTYAAVIPLADRPAGPLALSFGYELPAGRRRTLTRVITLARMRADSAGSCAFADSALRVSWDAGDLFYDVFVRAAAGNCGIEDDSLPVIAPCYTLHPQDVPFRKGVRVAVDLPNTVHDTARVGLYASWNGGRTWSWLSDALDRATGRVYAHVKGFAAYTLRTDYVPPAISGVKPGNGDRTEDGTPRIRARISDRGAGFDDRRIECRIDGDDVIYEWDAPLHELSYRPYVPLTPGAHALLIAVTDRAGNRTEYVGSFTVPE